MNESINKTWEFLVRHQIIIFLLLAMSLSFFIRVQPAILPITDDWAENSVAQYNEQIISTKILNEYPSLSYETRYQYFQQEYQKLLSEDKVYMPTEYGFKQGKYDEAVNVYSQYFKSRLQNEYGNSYLLAIDPYYYARFGRNVIENGHLGDVLVDGVPMETVKLAPSIRKADTNWHSYVNAYTFKISRLFGNEDPMKAFFYVPIIISVLSIIPCFFILRRHSGAFGGFVGSLLLASHSAFVSRTVGGFSDTDAYNIFFPLMILWMFILSLRNDDIKKKITFGVLGGLLVGVYSHFWSGWWYVFDFIIAAYGIFFLCKVIYNIKNGANWLYDLKDGLLFAFVPFFISSFIFYGFKTKEFFGVFLQYPLNVITLKDVATKTIWPNVLTTVAELNSVPMSQIISYAGGIILLTLTVLGIILYILLRLKYNPVQNLRNTLFHKSYLFYPIILTIFLLGALYASTKGIRFTLILVPVISLGVGTTFGLAYYFLSEKIADYLSIKQSFAAVMIVVATTAVLMLPVATGYNQAVHEVPSMNDAWYGSLQKIDNFAEQDAIITSWWDFGHWFKYVGNRGTTFDGASQSTPQAHWVGRLLQTGDEKEAINILRMLDCGGNNVYDIINKKYNDYESVMITKQIIGMNTTSVIPYMKDLNFTVNEIINVTENGLCEPPQGFVIASDDMVQKSGVWAHFGLWDFEKADIINTISGLTEVNAVSTLSTKMNTSRSDATDLYGEIKSVDANNWIAPWPGYLSTLNPCDEYENVVECNVRINNNIFPIIYNKNSTRMFEVYVKGNPKVSPVKYVNAVDGDWNVTEIENDDIPFGFLITKMGGTYYYMIADPLLIDSVFTRMFFLQGEGLECFDSFSVERQVTGGMIYIYEANWECGQ